MEATSAPSPHDDDVRTSQSHHNYNNNNDDDDDDDNSHDTNCNDTHRGPGPVSLAAASMDQKILRKDLHISKSSSQVCVSVLLLLRLCGALSLWLPLVAIWLSLPTMVITSALPSSDMGVAGGHPGGAAVGGGLTLAQVDGKSLFRSLRASTCSVDCSTAELEYICGTDGVTYASRCELQRAKQCDNKKVNGQRVKVRTMGPCPGDVTPATSKCLEERREARKNARKGNNSEVLIPSCNEDGTYSEVQCHKATNYCWCVHKEDGRVIPDTPVENKRPKCKVKRTKRKGKPTKKKKKKEEKESGACITKERQAFNAELVKVFSDEYERMLKARGPEAVNDAAPSDDDVKIEKKIVTWKFTQLDTNADGSLSFKEIRSFRRMVRKLIKPRRCAKRFHRFCDKDNDRKIAKKEWTLCLGVDIKPLNSQLDLSTSVPQDSRPPSHDPEPNPFPSLPRSPSDMPFLSERPLHTHPAANRTASDSGGRKNCLEEQKAAVVHALDEPSANIFIPRCQENGQWRAAQCHNTTKPKVNQTVTTYCWCVAVDTGVPIPGMATHMVEPNCTIQDDDREMAGMGFAGCPFEHKRRFIVTLMEDFKREMVNATGVPAPAQAASGEAGKTSSRENVAMWKLRSMDKNKNGVLERNEWRDMRKDLKKNKNYPRKCRRRFLRYCDANDDKSLTTDEWRDCLGLNHNLFSSLPRDPNVKGRKNPFLDQLT